MSIESSSRFFPKIASFVLPFLLLTANAVFAQIPPPNGEALDDMADLPPGSPSKSFLPPGFVSKQKLRGPSTATPTIYNDSRSAYLARYTLVENILGNLLDSHKYDYKKLSDTAKIDLKKLIDNSFIVKEREDGSFNLSIVFGPLGMEETFELVFDQADGSVYLLNSDLAINYITYLWYFRALAKEHVLLGKTRGGDIKILTPEEYFYIFNQNK